MDTQTARNGHADPKTARNGHPKLTEAAAPTASAEGRRDDDRGVGTTTANTAAPAQTPESLQKRRQTRQLILHSTGREVERTDLAKEEWREALPQSLHGLLIANREGGMTT